MEYRAIDQTAVAVKTSPNLGDDRKVTIRITFHHTGLFYLFVSSIFKKRGADYCMSNMPD